MRLRVTQEELCESLRSLVETGRTEMALRTVRRMIEDIHDQHAWVELRASLEISLGCTTVGHEPWLATYARVLRGCRDAAKILDLTRATVNPMVQLERAWALIVVERYDDAQTILNEIIPELQGDSLGFAYRFLTRIQFQQDGSWRETWAVVRQQLEGRTLGVALLDEAHQHAQFGDELQARLVASEASALLENDPYHLAWAQHAVGMSYLREEQTALAEAALLEAEQLTHKRRARAFRARALCGKGALLRAQGHLKRAETQYREAAKNAQEPDDLIEALWGAGHSLRLQGLPDLALEQFQRALRVKIDSRWVQVHRALALLMLKRYGEARIALRQAGQVSGATRQRLLVAKAEMAHSQGALEMARQELSNLPMNSLSAREESRLFPVLFALLKSHGPEQVNPVHVLERHVIEVTSDAGLQIMVNGCFVPVKANSRGAALLEVLLELNGRATRQELVARLWPQALNVTEKCKQLSQIINDLRRSLGWRDAIKVVRGVYQLDPDAEWRMNARA